MAVPASNYLLPYNFYSDLDTQAAGTLGIVLNDPTSSNNKIYESAGGGTWNAVATPPSNIDMFGLNVPNLFGLGTASGLLVGSVVTTTAGTPTIAPGTTLASINSASSITLSAAVTGSGATTLTFTSGEAVIAGVTGTANGTAVITLTPSTSFPTVQPSAGLYAAIRAGEVHLLAHGLAKADGSTDNAPIINWIGAILESRGGGKIVFDRPDSTGAWYAIHSPILLRNRVTFEGVDTSVLIRNTSTTSNQGACFHGNGMAQANYGYYTRYALNSISANDHAVTCSVTGSAANFSIGQVVLIFSKDGESPAGTVVSSVPAGGTNFIPYFSRQYRITNIVGEVISLDYAVTDAVANPVLCDGTGGSFGGIATKLIDNPVVRNVRLYANDIAGGNGKSFTGGCYEGLFENIVVDQAIALFNVNGFARSRIDGLRGVFTDKAIELATGSHDSQINAVRGTYLSNNTSAGLLVQAAEYTANNEISDFRLYAPDYSVSASLAFYVVQTTGFLARDGYVLLNGRGIGVTQTLSVANSNVEFRNIDFSLSSQAANFDVANVHGYSVVPTDIRLRNVRFLGSAPSANSCRFSFGCGVDFDDVDLSNGTILVSSGITPTGPMSRVKYGGWAGSGSISSLDKRGMIRSGGAYAAAQYLVNVSTTSTTANNTVATYALPAGFVATAGDQFVLEASADVSSDVTHSKSFAVADDTGVAGTVTVATTDTGTVVIRAVMTLESNSIASLAGTIVYPVGAGFSTIAFKVRRTGLNILTNGRNLKLEAWVSNAAATITFNSIAMYPKLVGE